jgi:ferredoxin-type protein NapH
MNNQIYKKGNRRQKIRIGIILVSFFLLPAVFYYLSPYLIIDATIRGIINGSFIFFIFLFVSSLFLGRAYCGWICPAAGCQEALFPARDKKIIKGNFIKWIIWIPWVSAIVILAIRNGGYQEIDFFYRTKFGLSIDSVYSFLVYLGVLSLIVIPALLVGKRSFCHHICWMAPFLIIGRKAGNAVNLPSLQLALNDKKCSHCHTCTSNCPMSLPVELMVQEGKMENTECILCGTCIDGCKKKMMRYVFTKSYNKKLEQVA